MCVCVCGCARLCVFTQCCVRMSSSSLDALLQEKAALSAELARTSRELKQGRDRHRGAVRALASQWQLTHHLRRTTLIIYGLSDYVVDPAVKFLTNTGKQRHWPARSEDALRGITEELFLNTDPDEFAALVDTTNPLDPSAMQAALRVVREWRLLKWTGDLNYDKGVAPTTDAVLHQLEQERLRLPEAVRPDPMGDVEHARARQWARRWRARWGVRYGQIHVREAVALEDMRSKAAPCFRLLLGRKTAPSQCTISSCSATKKRSQNWDRLAVPVSGPKSPPY